MKYVPNALTIVRLCLTPVVAFLVIDERWLLAAAAVWVAGFTDFLDGFIARRYDLVTRLGTMLDPIVDRVAVVVISGALVAAGVLPLGLVAVVVLRDLLVAAGFMYVMGRGGKEPKVTLIGKTATFFLLLSLPVLLLGEQFGEPWRAAGLSAFVLGAVLYWVAAFGYARLLRSSVDPPLREAR